MHVVKDNMHQSIRRSFVDGKSIGVWALVKLMISIRLCYKKKKKKKKWHGTNPPVEIAWQANCLKINTVISYSQTIEVELFGPPYEKTCRAAKKSLP